MTWGMRRARLWRRMGAMPATLASTLGKLGANRRRGLIRFQARPASESSPTFVVTRSNYGLEAKAAAQGIGPSWTPFDFKR